jgi:hypothetical protein
MRRPRLKIAVLVAAIASMLAVAETAHALTFVIANGTAQIYLRIGQTGGTVNVVSFAVTGANGGNGTAIAGTVVAAAGAASAAQTPNFAACPANYVRIVARARSTAAAPRTATLSVNSTASISGGGNTIPFTQFDWVSDDAADLPAGTFTGAPAQPLTSFTTSREVGACHQFRFLNTQVYPSGTYTGNLVYNLQMP